MCKKKLDKSTYWVRKLFERLKMSDRIRSDIHKQKLSISKCEIEITSGQRVEVSGNTL